NLKTKDGTVYRFGYDTNSAMIHPADSNLVWRWSLDLINDTYDNDITYTYGENSFTGDSTAVYPHKIEYNNDKSRVVDFFYEDSTRPDNVMIYDNAAKVNESRRLKEITVSADGALVRRYKFDYSKLNGTFRTAISSITVYGSDNTTSLPPVNFDYSDINEGWTANGVWNVPASMNFIDATNEDEGVRFADLNGDGYIDMLRAQANGPHEQWLNNGAGWQNTTMWNTTDKVVFVLANGQDNGTRIVDINNDGLPDILYAAGKERDSYINTGSGWSKNSTWNVPSEMSFVDLAAGKDLGVRMFDVNGDGWIDLIKTTTTEQAIFLNNGSLTPATVWSNASSWVMPQNAAFVDSVTAQDKGVRIVDVNADGYADALQGNATNVKTWLNDGRGQWMQDPLWNIPAGAIFINSTVDEQGIRIADANGDGLPDLVMGFASTKQTWLNNASGWQLNDSWALPAVSYVTFVTSAGKNKGLRIVDVNGDELPDLLYYDLTYNGAYVNNAAKAYLLDRVEYDFGGYQEFTYSSSTQFNESGYLDYMNFNLWLVSQVDKNNTMTDGHLQVYDNNYDYSSGRFDYRERKFRGFEYVEELKDDTLVKHHYYQDDARAGKEKSVSVHNAAGALYENTTYDWEVVNKDGYNVSLLVGQRVESYDSGATFRAVNTTYSYDEFGNVLEINHSGDMGHTGDETYEVLQYVNNSDNWVVDSLENHSVYDYDASTLMKRIRYKYDNNDYSQVPTKGYITFKSDWGNVSGDFERSYGYDVYGNVLQMNDTFDRMTNYTFDGTGTFVHTVENHLGHVSKYSYDLGTGNLIAMNDSNTVETNYTYDVFARPLKVIQAYDDSTYPTKEYEYDVDGTAPERITVYTREVAGSTENYNLSYYYDGFGNLIQVKTPAADTSLQIAADIYYDDWERPIKTSNAYYVDIDEDYTTADDTVPAFEYTYDPMNRVTQVINPDETTIIISFSLWNVTTTNENGVEKDYVLDGYGNIIQVVEHIDASTQKTYYNYDALNNLVKITDASSNVFNFTYDSLSRKLTMDDPDMGVWTYTYDAEGNLLSQTGSAGELITDGDYYREYNDQHQLIRVRSGGAEGTILEEYRYDPNGDRIKTVRYNEDGTTETIYTPFREWMQIVNSTGSYNYTYVYDGATLVARLNPDGTKQFYHNDHLGSTTVITNETGDVIEETFYTPFGQTTSGGEQESYYLYTNQFKDAIGCYDYGARVYCPGWYHFTSADPVMINIYDPQNLNHYSYARNNPYLYVDVGGLWAEQKGGKVDASFLIFSISLESGITYSYGDDGTFEAGMYYDTSADIGLDTDLFKQGKTGKFKPTVVAMLKTESTPEAQSIKELEEEDDVEKEAYIAYGIGYGRSSSEDSSGEMLVFGYGASYSETVDGETNVVGFFSLKNNDAINIIFSDGPNFLVSLKRKFSDYSSYYKLKKKSEDESNDPNSVSSMGDGSSGGGGGKCEGCGSIRKTGSWKKKGGKKK
ncbi:hypothetical protein COV16_00915, partial [Candidatus Woesearchaeota archaeon CG10_big_fil_rev_8_21_14_0_10_34_8]